MKYTKVNNALRKIVLIAYRIIQQVHYASHKTLQKMATRLCNLFSPKIELNCMNFISLIPITSAVRSSTFIEYMISHYSILSSVRMTLSICKHNFNYLYHNRNYL